MKQNNTSLNSFQGFKPKISAYIKNGGGYVIDPRFPFAIGTNVPFVVKIANQFELLTQQEWAGGFQYISSDVPSIEAQFTANITAQFAAIDDVITLSLYKNGINCSSTTEIKQFIAHNSFLNLTFIDQVTLNTNDRLNLYMSSVNGNELQDMQINVIINTI
jgi:hypothetical protein